MSLKCNVLKSGFCELTQGFGGANNHRGLDLVDKGYTIGDVVSYGNGTVVMVTNGYGNGQGEGVNWAYGNFVKILHDDGTVCLYAHMEYTSVSYNQRVSKGQVIGRMGNSGNSNGGHLHWEYWARNDYNSNVDPMPYLEPKPIITVPNPVIENKDVDQIKVICGDNTLRVRISHSTNDTFIGFAKPGLYNIISTFEDGTYVWYQVEQGKWFANVQGCTEYIYKYIAPVIEEKPIIEQPVITEPTTPTENDDIKPVEEDKQEDNTNTTEIEKVPKSGFKLIIYTIIKNILDYLKERYNNDKKNFKGN